MAQTMKKKGGHIVISFRLNLDKERDKMIYDFLYRFDKAKRPSIIRMILYEVIEALIEDEQNRVAKE